jgi:hypothetical protein
MLYEIDHLEKKLAYLQRMQSSREGSSGSIDGEEYDRFFDDLRMKFDEHNSFMKQFIDEIYENNYQEMIQKLEKEI